MCVVENNGKTFTRKTPMSDYVAAEKSTNKIEVIIIEILHNPKYQYIPTIEHTDT